MRLPDAMLVRDAWMGGAPRRRVYDGHTYIGASAWIDEWAARVAADEIRAAGSLARVTREPLPHRARPGVRTYSRCHQQRPQKTNIISPRRGQSMWIVWRAIDVAEDA